MSTVTGFRISPQQAAYWQQCRDADVQHGNTYLAIELEQAPDEPLLRERLRQLVAREEILRTRLHSLPSMALPIQMIDGTADIALETRDWRDISASEQAARLRELSEQPMGNGILRVVLARTAASHWALLLMASRIHLDATSLWLITQALVAEEIGQDRLQYADYAEWKHSLLEDDPSGPGVQFWRQLRVEMSAPLLPGLEMPSAQMGSTAFDATDTGITWQDLQQRSAALGVKPEEYLFAAWCVLLGRLRGQRGVSLAWIDAGRGEGLENALGLYEQALPVQASFDSALPLQVQLEDLLTPLRSARGWQDYFDSSQSCDCYFAYRRLPGVSSVGAQLDLRSVNGRFGLGLDCIEIAEADQVRGLQCRLSYDNRRFSAIAIACLTEQWRLLLQGLHLSSVAVGAIPLQGELQTGLLTPPATEPVIEPVSLPELIARQVRANPNALALADNSGTLSYQELASRSNRLARCLQASGLQPGDVVGILLSRGNPMIVAILAVLKAGGAYLPLDPSYPADRLAFLVQDSDVQHVLSTQAHSALLPQGTQCLLLEDVPWSDLVDDDLPPVSNLGQPAYLIYTSGSTGRPKAVEITHANLSHSTQVRIGYYDSPVNAYLLLSSFAFDSSVAGIFWTLAQGGLLVLPASGEELDLAILANLIKRHRISHSLSLPSLYETLLDYGNRDTFTSITTWIVAGEPCSPQVLSKHRGKAPNARLVNEYGPTEATVWATADVLYAPTAADAMCRPLPQTASDISIGRPIPTLSLWLVNESGMVAAIGEPGEIQLGGPTLAPGYCGHPEQTAQAFVSSPDIAAGARRYKTGDLARWGLDGRLCFLGRADHQVKIRGYRVELGEIERLLVSHSEVREAVVIAQDLANGKRLVAYITDRHGYPPETRALSDYLSSHLPAYMVPSAFVHLKSLPRTPNGKVDLKALPDPVENADAAADYVAPRNEMEAELAAICADVLRRKRVGVHENFFQIGGDSILSLQIVARANQRGIRLTAKQVFESETVARMAVVATSIDLTTATAAAGVEACQAGPRDTASSLDLSLAGLDADGFEAMLAELESND